ncbi:transglutaminase domain-containing protein [Psychroserpens algicola]|uniref:Transglutaminase-like domain-containing protein n=1 Tax=Psychroserpens algicola TaxID=1719034 RepID=A0ABT0H901_9FLAO|nr:hypothetical protein [Psychroserpens algicola]
MSKEELRETYNSADTSANATVLYRNESIKFNWQQDKGFFQVRKVHERIKIYNKEGFDWASKKVRLFSRSAGNSESLNDLKGYTYNLENDKIVKGKLKKNGVFEEVANKYWKFKSFTMPSIKEGCVIEFSYEIESPYLQIDDILFQYTIPIKQFDLSINTIEYFTYNKLLNPKSDYYPKLTETVADRELDFSYRQETTYRGGANMGIEKAKTIKDVKRLYENVIRSSSINIPALNEEPFIDNLENYRAKLILELVAVKYPNEHEKRLSTSWDKVTETIYKNPSFGDQLDKSSYYKDDVDAILAGVTDPVEKSFLIFNYVKSKINWNDFYGYASDIGVRKAYKDGVGNVADINLMLISMLRYAGLRANPVLVSTKNNGIPLFPTRQGFNYVICMIESEDFNVLLDATEDYSTYNVLPTRVLNWQGRVIRENGSSAWINLSPSSLSTDVTSLNVKINPDLTIEGKVRQQKTDYTAMNYRNRYANLSTDEHIKSLERNNGELEIMDIEIENNKDYTKPLKLTYDYNLVDGIEEIGENLYLSPMLFFASEDNPFKQETRNFPIDLTYPFSDKYIINIMIPEGYAIESLPQSGKIQFNDVGDFTYLSKQNGSFLQLTVSLNMKTSIILAQDYETFKEFYSKVIEKQSEKIVLKKI